MSGAGCSWSHTLKEWERRPGKVNWSRIQYYCKSEKRGNTAPQKERGSEWNTRRLSWARVSWLTLQSNVVASPLQLPFLHFFFFFFCQLLFPWPWGPPPHILTAHDFPISFWDCLSGPSTAVLSLPAYDLPISLLLLLQMLWRIVWKEVGAEMEEVVEKWLQLSTRKRMAAWIWVATVLREIY